MSKNTQLHISPARSFGVVILNRYPELATKFIASIRKTHKQLPPIVVVRDRNEATYDSNVKIVDGSQPFVFARNANIGIQYFASMDIILCNDDLECVKKDFFYKLYAIANAYPKCGIMSSLIKGGVGNEVQSYYHAQGLPKGTSKQAVVKSTMHFPCVLLKRKMLRKIGLFDENFTGYGFEDVDYSIRAYWAGFDLMVTRQLYIVHGDGTDGIKRGLNYSLSFIKERDEEISLEYFQRKYQYQFRPTGNGARVYHGG